MVENNDKITYNGFVTPCLILEGSDTSDRGNIVDPYAKTEQQDGLLCGAWSKGLDKLIHIYLVKPVAAICNEREEWVAKQMLLKEPIDYAPPPETEELSGEKNQKTSPVPKKKLVLDPDTKQFKMM